MNQAKVLPHDRISVGKKTVQEQFLVDVISKNKVDTILNKDVIFAPEFIQDISLLSSIYRKADLIFFNISSQFKINDKSIFSHLNRDAVELFKNFYELLSEEGSIYIICNNETMPYIKVQMDEVFGQKNCINIIYRIFKKVTAYNTPPRNFDETNEVILLYSKTNKYIWNNIVKLESDEEVASKYPHKDERGQYKLVPMFMKMNKPSLKFKWMDVEPPEGYSWRFSEEKLKKLYDEGLIYFSKNGNPRQKYYLDTKSKSKSKYTNYTNVWDEFIYPTPRDDRFVDNEDVKFKLRGYHKNMYELMISNSSKKDSLIVNFNAGYYPIIEDACKLERQCVDIVINREYMLAELQLLGCINSNGIEFEYRILSNIHNSEIFTPKKDSIK